MQIPSFDDLLAGSGNIGDSLWLFVIGFIVAIAILALIAWLTAYFASHQRWIIWLGLAAGALEAVHLMGWRWSDFMRIFE